MSEIALAGHSRVDRRPAFVPTLAALLVLAVASGCAPVRSVPQPESDGGSVVAALERYRLAALRMDVRAITALLPSNASMAHESHVPVVGRDGIRRFLESFATFKVLTYDLAALETTVDGTTARQRGQYAQTVRIPGGSAVRVNGTFRAEWRLTPQEWQIVRTRTAGV